MVTSYTFPAISDVALPSLVDSWLRCPAGLGSLRPITQPLIKTRLWSPCNKAVAGSGVDAAGAVETLLLISAHWGVLLRGFEVGRQKTVRWRCSCHCQRWETFSSCLCSPFFPFGDVLHSRSVRSPVVKTRHVPFNSYWPAPWKSQTLVPTTQFTALMP